MYSGAPSDAIAAHAVFLETASVLAIVLIGHRCSMRINAYRPDIPDLTRAGFDLIGEIRHLTVWNAHLCRRLC